MLRYVSDPSPEVRQAAVYGVGMMGAHGGPEYVPIIKEVCARVHVSLVVCLDAQSLSLQSIRPHALTPR
jgi:hypothetical protein